MISRLRQLLRIVRTVAGKVKANILKISANAWLISLCAVLLLATQATLIWANMAGIYMNVVTLLVLTGCALWREDVRKLCISLAILPAAQMVSSSVILSTNFHIASLFYGDLIILSMMYRYLFTLDEPVEVSRLKLRGHAFGIPLMLVLGQGLGAVGYLFIRNHYPYQGTSLPLVALASVVFAFAEEMFLRGLIQKQTERVVNPIFAVVLTTALYVGLAISHTTMLTVGPAILMGGVLALTYYFKQNLLLSVTINAAAKLTYVGLVATFVLR